MTAFECSAFPQLGTNELDQAQHYRWDSLIGGT